MIFTDYVSSVDAEFSNKVDREESSFNGGGHFLRHWLAQYGYRNSTGKSPVSSNEVRAWNLAAYYYGGVV